jgi:hypothetical protein
MGRRRSDYDIAISGDSVYAAACERGVPLRTDGLSTGPLSDTDLRALGVDGIRPRRVGGRRPRGRTSEDLAMQHTAFAESRPPTRVRRLGAERRLPMARQYPTRSVARDPKGSHRTAGYLAADVARWAAIASND